MEKFIFIYIAACIADIILLTKVTKRHQTHNMPLGKRIKFLMPFIVSTIILCISFPLIMFVSFNSSNVNSSFDTNSLSKFTEVIEVETETATIENITKTSTETTTTEISTQTSTEITTKILEPTTKSQINETIYFDKFLKGRGLSDIGRDTPDYIGKYGYVAIYDTDIENNIDSIKNTPWYVPTYSKIDADHYEVTGQIEHKTVIKILNQSLTHEGWGVYSGYLYAEIVDSSKNIIIDVNNFITNNYWNYDIEKAISYGVCLAKYHQVSNFFPVYNDNEIVKLNDGQLLLIEGKTEHRTSGLDSNVRPICCRILDGKNNDISIYLNTDDIKIIY